MSYVLSRIPPAHNQALLTLVSGEGSGDLAMQRLNDNPVLVAVHRGLIADREKAGMPANEHARRLFLKSLTFVEQHNLVPVDSDGNVLFYDWYPHGKK